MIPIGRGVWIDVRVLRDNPVELAGPGIVIGRAGVPDLQMLRPKTLGKAGQRVTKAIVGRGIAVGRRALIAERVGHLA